MTRTTKFGFSVDVPLAYEQADLRVRELLKARALESSPRSMCGRR
jgi:hypothetical protein